MYSLHSITPTYDGDVSKKSATCHGKVADVDHVTRTKMYRGSLGFLTIATCENDFEKKDFGTSRNYHREKSANSATRDGEVCNVTDFLVSCRSRGCRYVTGKST